MNPNNHWNKLYDLPIEQLPTQTLRIKPGTHRTNTLVPMSVN